MERFEGKAHLPGAEREWSIDLEIDWGEKDVTVRSLDAPGGLKEWPGLVVQTFGPMEEIVFRTKGMPLCSPTGGILPEAGTTNWRGLSSRLPMQMGYGAPARW
jgi:hypothetical protein